MRVQLEGALVVALFIGVPLVLVGMLGLGWLEGWRVRRRQRSVRRRPDEQLSPAGFGVRPQSPASAAVDLSECPLEDDGWLQSAELAVRSDRD